jgi:hypothetical protein
MLEYEQYKHLLADGVIEGMIIFLNTHGLRNYKLVTPYAQADKNKINILAE